MKQSLLILSPFLLGMAIIRGFAGDTVASDDCNPALFSKSQTLIMRLMSNEVFRATFSNEIESLHPMESAVVQEAHQGEVSDLLASRLVRFATWLPDHRTSSERPTAFAKSSPQMLLKMPPPLSNRFSDDELSANAETNAMRRLILLYWLHSHYSEMDDEVQKQWMFACDRIWIHPPYYPDGGRTRAAIRRKEDGISSERALFEWFAENDFSCKEVRIEALSRLSNLESAPVAHDDSSEETTVKGPEM